MQRTKRETREGLELEGACEVKRRILLVVSESRWRAYKLLETIWWRGKIGEEEELQEFWS